MSFPRRPAATLVRTVLAFQIGAIAFTAIAHAGPNQPCRKRCVDTAAPSIVISAPSSGASLSGTAVVSGTASDAVGVAKVEIRVDDGAWQPASGTTSWSRSLDTRTLSDGSHSIAVRASDAAGNAATNTVAVSVTNAPPPDTTAPDVSIASPGQGTTVGGTITATGNASDAVGVSKIEVRVDSGSWQLASGTSFWSHSIDTTSLSDGSHTVTTRATDAAGNASSATVGVTVSNAPPADTTAPSVAISAPGDGASVSGSITASGSASDDVGVSAVEVRVDSGAWQAASGTSSWSRTVDTTSLANGTHTITTRATDAAGNAGTATRSITVSNSTTAPSTTTGTWTSPEGTTIDIAADVSGWTHAEIYRMLVENGLDGTIGSLLTVKVQTKYASAVASSASETGGRYDAFTATMYLKATASTGFTNAPDATVGHEFGHVWTLYHLYMSQQGDWSSWLSARSIANDPRLESSYNWAKNEIIADDYRLLFGSPAAIAQRPAHLNADLPDPRNVPGLRDFFQDVWSVGVTG